jgi:hypothetical protein
VPTIGVSEWPTGVRPRPTGSGVLTADDFGCCALWPRGSGSNTCRALRLFGRNLGPAFRVPALRKPGRLLGVLGAADLTPCHRPALELSGSLLAVDPWIEGYGVLAALDLAVQRVQVVSACPVIAHKVSVGVAVLHLETRRGKPS